MQFIATIWFILCVLKSTKSTHPEGEKSLRFSTGWDSRWRKAGRAYYRKVHKEAEELVISKRFVQTMKQKRRPPD